MHLLVLEKVMSSNKKRDFAFRGGRGKNCGYPLSMCPNLSATI